MKLFSRTVRVLAFLALSFAAAPHLQGANTNVIVQNNRFTPANVTVAVGDTVTWIFREAGHDTVNKQGTTYGNVWNSGIKAPNTTFVFTFNTAGTFPYVCRPHENINMVGTITVQGAANTPPTVSLTGPANGATFSTADSINFTADASDPGGSVTQVQFLRGGSTVIGSDTSSPYSVAAQLPAGTHTITARATDNGGLTTTSSSITITVNAPNQAPTVSVTSPANGASFLTTDTITFSANAADDVVVNRVEFLDGGSLIGSADTSAPYSVTAQLSAGTHVITARATDSAGLSTTSSSVTITVTTPNQPPTVSLTSPANGATFTTADTITFSANATDDSSVAKVEFLSHGSLIGTADTSAPYSITASLPAGSHVITAKATDNAGLSTTSAGITITVTTPPSPPTITLASPQAGQTITAPGTVTLSATATDDGSITQVQFFQGNTVLSTDTSAPYETTASNLAAGTYTFSAIATDNSGLATTSSTIQVTVGAATAPQLTASRNGSTITISSPATDGKTYELESTTDFINWAPVTTQVAAGGSVTFLESTSATMRFYRIEAL